MIPGKIYLCIDERGVNKILTCEKSKWTGELCFTDGEEYYYLKSHKDLQYGDNIVSYTPYGWKEPVWPLMVGFVLYSLACFWIRFNFGAIDRSMDNIEVMIGEIENEARNLNY